MLVWANVVANGSGAFDTSGLTLLTPTLFGGDGGIRALDRTVVMKANAAAVQAVLYTGAIGPHSFGSGNFFVKSSFSGDFFAFNGDLILPQGYQSGHALSDMMTFNGQTFATMGLTPGTYVWSWGDGANQNFTLQIGSVPDGGTTASLLGCALLGLAGLRRKLGC